MKFIETELKGAFIIELTPFVDDRGIFARTFCHKEFAEYGLDFDIKQSNFSFTNKKHTIRGMHFQKEGFAEIKLVRCVQGNVLDVIIDIRKNSPTFGKHIKVKLSSDNNKMLYVPKGFAHGFLSLVDNCQFFYQVSEYYSPGMEGGLRWNDPFFNIEWGVTNPIISSKDASAPDYTEEIK